MRSVRKCQKLYFVVIYFTPTKPVYWSSFFWRWCWDLDGFMAFLVSEFIHLFTFPPDTKLK